MKTDRMNICAACRMIESGVKSRKALSHTCDEKLPKRPEHGELVLEDMKKKYKTQYEEGFAKGMKAYDKGIPLNGRVRNPYKSISFEGLAWNHGYLDGWLQEDKLNIKTQ